LNFDEERGSKIEKKVKIPKKIESRIHGNSIKSA